VKKGEPIETATQLMTMNLQEYLMPQNDAEKQKKINLTTKEKEILSLILKYLKRK
jgi:hypothetical protein